MKICVIRTTIVHFLVFLTKILPCAFLSREALSNHRNRHTMDFKLPHDVVCTCAKRDEPPSRRRPFRFILDQNIILSTNSSERWPTSARHSVYSVYSVDCPKLVFIRVNSWFHKSDLVAALTAPGDLWFDKNSCAFVLIRGSFFTIFHGWRLVNSEITCIVYSLSQTMRV